MVIKGDHYPLRRKDSLQSCDHCRTPPWRWILFWWNRSKCGKPTSGLVSTLNTRRALMHKSLCCVSCKTNWRYILHIRNDKSFLLTRSRILWAWGCPLGLKFATYSYGCKLTFLTDFPFIQHPMISVIQKNFTVRLECTIAVVKDSGFLLLSLPWRRCNDSCDWRRTQVIAWWLLVRVSLFFTEDSMRLTWNNQCNGS
jgi:hypothetical protein